MTTTNQERLVMPETIPENPSDYEAFMFIRGIFADNGCLGEYRDQVLSGKYFDYGYSDSEARQITTEQYLVSKDRPIVVFGTNVARVSRSDFEARQKRQSQWSSGFNSMATVGDETYTFSTLAVASGLQAPTTQLRASYIHESGDSTGLGASRIRVGLSGRLVSEVTEALDLPLFPDPNKARKRNSLVIAKLVEILA